MVSANPYAPPAEAPIPEALLPPLPGGIRRYALEPLALRAYLGRVSRAALLRAFFILVVLLAILLTGGPGGKDALIVLWPPMVVALVVTWLLQRLRVARVEPKVIEGYELLVGPRALRRTSYGAPPAEILAPEVASIVEVPDGLSIFASKGNGRLFVLRALAGYAEIRDHVARWRPIEQRGGIQGWLRKRAHRKGERTHERVLGTVLEHDDALLEELTALRGAAKAPDLGSIRRIRWLRRVSAAIWVVAGMFVLLWVLLTPPAKPVAAPATAAPRGQSH